MMWNKISRHIKLALSKGRVFEEVLPILNSLGIFIIEDIKTSRKLEFNTSNINLSIIIVRSIDVPVYVRFGIADFGIVGKDILMEYGYDGLYKLLDLNLACCRMSIAASNNFNYFSSLYKKKYLRVATKYTVIASRYFVEKGINIKLIKLYGSIELAPIVGLSDIIVDLVSSGRTLIENNLIEVEKIMSVYSCIIVNPVSLKMKGNFLFSILKSFEFIRKLCI